MWRQASCAHYADHIVAAENQWKLQNPIFILLLLFYQRTIVQRKKHVSCWCRGHCRNVFTASAKTYLSNASIKSSGTSDSSSLPSPLINENRSDVRQSNSSSRINHELSVSKFNDASIRDKNGHVPTGIDVKLSESHYGECARDNDGTHLDGSTLDDEAWKNRCK